MLLRGFAQYGKTSLFTIFSQKVNTLAYIFITKICLGQFSIQLQGLLWLAKILVSPCHTVSYVFCSYRVLIDAKFQGLLKNINCVLVPVLQKKAQSYFFHRRDLQAGVLLGLLKHRNCRVIVLIFEQAAAVFILEAQVGGVIFNTFPEVVQFHLVQLPPELLKLLLQGFILRLFLQLCGQVANPGLELPDTEFPKIF